MKFLSILTLIFSVIQLGAQEAVIYQQQEVIYGRKDGMALTMQVLQPKKPVNRAIINLISGNWRSSYSRPEQWLPVSKIYLDKGYTVFNVVHGSQPRYAIPDAAADVTRAVRYIRFNAKRFGIDPNYIGIVGSSSGGHLALLAGLSDNAGTPTAADSVNRVSGKVQAIACFNPPTDFLNWGAPGLNPVNEKEFLQQMGVLGAFQFTRYYSTRVALVPLTDTTQINLMARKLSPFWQITADDAPVLIWHGDADRVVPIEQSQKLIQAMQAQKIPALLKVKSGADHEWSNMLNEEKDFAAWFDKHLFAKSDK